MSSHPVSSHPVVFNRVGLDWPDGTPLFDDLTATFGAGRTGVVGANGAGKSTLLRLVLGELTPTRGSVAVAGVVGHLPQHVALRQDTALADLLGIRARLEALRAIEAGDAGVQHFEALADDWDVEARAVEAVASAGLGVELDRPVRRMSGGEVVLAAIVGLQLLGAPVVCLDEPTNNLDRPTRERLYALVDAWRATLLIVSHDVALLERMDATVELRDGVLSLYGGGYSAYVAQVEAEQDAAARALRSAEQTLRTERRQKADAQVKLARRTRTGARDYANKRAPRAVMKQWARDAQVSAGELRGEAEEKVAAAEATVREREDAIRRDVPIKLDLPDPGVPASRRLGEFASGGRTFVLAGPERVALVGPNGVGKTRLLQHWLGVGPDGPGRPPGIDARLLTDRVGYLPQRIDLLDDRASVLDNVSAVAPRADASALRERLSRLAFHGDDVFRPVGTLSGGERFRVALARLLLAEPPAQLLVLDEPTNSLDLQTVGVLVDALAGYRGGVLVVSHDDDFLGRLGVTRRLQVSPDGLTELQ